MIRARRCLWCDKASGSIIVYRRGNSAVYAHAICHDKFFKDPTRPQFRVEVSTTITDRGIEPSFRFVAANAAAQDLLEEELELKGTGETPKQITVNGFTEGIAFDRYLKKAGCVVEVEEI